MKILSFILTIALLCFFGNLTMLAQPSSSLTPAQLSFLNAGNPFANATLSISGLSIANNFNSANITENSVSAGSDLLRSIIDGNGFTTQDYAVFPASHSNLNRKKMTFETEGQGLVGLDRETWTFGITDVGAFDANDAVQSALSLRYFRIIDDIAITFPILFVNPDQGDIGIGTTAQNFGGRLYVEESSGNQVGVWAVNQDPADASRWGVYGNCNGSGSSLHYGVYGNAQGGTGTKYGVYGLSSGSGTQYAVYASGNLAYTGTFGQVSDRKFKKNIRDFSALDRIMDLQPKTYEMKQEEFKRMNLASGRQFGFIAQEMQEVFPELVHDAVNAIPYEVGKDSLATEEIKYLSVDYISLVPVLTKGMQEQQKILEDKEERIERLERENATMKDRLDQLEILVQQLSKGNSSQDNSGVYGLSNASLLQNQPNPFHHHTTIPHFVPEGVQKAELQIADAAGRIIKTIEVSGRGEAQTVLDTQQLSKGTYFYSLILDGKLLDTKKMVLSGE